MFQYALDLGKYRLYDRSIVSNKKVLKMMSKQEYKVRVMVVKISLNESPPITIMPFHIDFRMV